LELLVAITKIDILTFRGRSGRDYDFRVYVWDTRFKALPGVYLVATRTIEPGSEPLYTPLFVESTADLSKALKAHRRADCFTLHYANVIGVLKETDAKTRDAIAADLVAGLAPACNQSDAQ
jgi:hypothetical protein